MMEIKLQNTTTAKFSYRSAGWAAISSGVIGVLAIGSLIVYLATRTQTPDTGILMNRFHDGGVILQFLFMIPVAIGIQKLSKLQSPFLSQAILFIGIATICLVVLFLLLIFPKVVADILYMIPQGMFGAWLIFVNTRMKGIFSKGLRWFGIVVGVGLVIVGLFPVGYAIFVDSVILRIPLGDPANYPEPPINLANTILHQMIWIGTSMGIATLPIWTILLGARFLREKRAVAQLGQTEKKSKEYEHRKKPTTYNL